MCSDYRAPCWVLQADAWMFRHRLWISLAQTARSATRSAQPESHGTPVSAQSLDLLMLRRRDEGRARNPARSRTPQLLQEPPAAPAFSASTA